MWRRKAEGNFILLEVNFMADVSILLSRSLCDVREAGPHYVKMSIRWKPSAGLFVPPTRGTPTWWPDIYKVSLLTPRAEISLPRNPTITWPSLVARQPNTAAETRSRPWNAAIWRNTESSVWDVRKVKHYIQETIQVYCLLMVHTRVGESGVCVTAH